MSDEPNFSEIDLEDDNQDTDIVSSLTREAERVVNRKYACVSPLAAYMRALCQQTFCATHRMEDWLKGLNGFNQSPKVRAWVVGMALAESWRYKDDYDYNPLLGYYLNLVGDDIDLPILCAYMSTRSTKNLNAMVGLFKGMVRMLQGLSEKSPFAKVLIAYFQAWFHEEEQDPELIRQYLLETADVKSPFLVQLRNIAIVDAKLEQEIGIIEPEPELNELDPKWLNNFIGYAFMDYTA